VLFTLFYQSVTVVSQILALVSGTEFCSIAGIWTVHFTLGVLARDFGFGLEMGQDDKTKSDVGMLLCVWQGSGLKMRDEWM
jgi:hypothetical protein